MQTEELKALANRALDGMSFSRDKLARNTVKLCEAHELTRKALEDERLKCASLKAQLEASQKSAHASPSSFPFEGMEDIFSGKDSGDRGFFTKKPYP